MKKHRLLYLFKDANKKPLKSIMLKIGLFLFNYFTYNFADKFLSFLFSIAFSISPLNNGCERFGLDLNSG